MFSIETASEALARIMEAESSQAWEPYGDKDARIKLSTGELLVISRQRIAEAATEIRLESEQMYHDSNETQIAEGWHYCSEHNRLEPNGECETAIRNGEDMQ